MAFVSKEKKAKIAAALKIALKGKKIKYSLRVHHHSEIVMTIYHGECDFEGEYKGDSEYVKKSDIHTGYQLHGSRCIENFETNAADLLTKIMECLNIDNHDRSDIQTDYFDVGHYVQVNIGQHDKPYVVIA